jgi:rod shape-determining protein MreC
VLILLALPFAFYLSNSKDPRDHNFVDRAVVTLSVPVQWLTVAVLDGVTGIWRRYIYLVDLEAENEQLRDENAALVAQVQAREEARLENERLHRLLDLGDRAPTVDALVARVIATSPTPMFRSIRVDHGTRHGVHPGAAVVNHDGVIGRVVGVGPWNADVMLLVDVNNSVDVLVQRTRARARVRGSGGDEKLGVDVQYLARTDDVEPGDILITSGTGSVFPKGLTVGTVRAVERGAFGLHQRAVVEPSVDFSRLEEVMIIPRGWPDEASYEPEPESDAVATAPDGAGQEPVAPAAQEAPPEDVPVLPPSAVPAGVDDRSASPAGQPEAVDGRSASPSTAPAGVDDRSASPAAAPEADDPEASPALPEGGGR